MEKICIENNNLGKAGAALFKLLPHGAYTSRSVSLLCRWFHEANGNEVIIVASLPRCKAFICEPFNSSNIRIFLGSFC